MTVLIDTDKQQLTIEHLGATMRTIMAAANTGYTTTGNRIWQIVYKGAYIGKVQVASAVRPPAKIKAKSDGA